MKIYDYKLTKSLSWCLVLCMSLFFMTNSVSAQDEISCDDQVNVSVGADCMFNVAPGLFTEGAFDGVMVHFSTNPVTSVAIGDDVELECGTYTVTVEDASNNSCWGTVVVEDKLPPIGVSPCPPDNPCTLDCFEFAGGNFPASDQSLYETSVTDCSEPVNIVGPSTVLIEAVLCENPDTLHLIYNPVDAKGNVGADTLTYLITKHRLADIMTPAPYTGDCGDDRCPGPLADGLPGSPSVMVNGVAIPLAENAFANTNGCCGEGCSSGTAQVCDILISYEDLDLPACPSTCSNSLKIIRSWTYLDWCTQETRGPEAQIIHLKDVTPPVIAGFTGETEFATDPWLCVADVDLPVPTITDNCDTGGLGYTVVGPAGVEITGSSASGYTALNAPKGVHTFTYYATDCCGNVSAAATVTITVFDGTAPVAIAKQFTVVSLAEDPRDPGNAFAKMYAGSLDNGSYDRCTEVHLEIRRDGFFGYGSGSEDDLDWNTTTPEYPCDIVGNDTYNNDNYLGGTIDNPPGTIDIRELEENAWDIPTVVNPDIDPDHGEYVKFCCEDLSAATVDVNYDNVPDTGYVKVWLRVWDNADMSMDAEGNPTYGTEGDYYNETWGFVKVEVSTPPQLETNDWTINCDWPWEQKVDEGYFDPKSPNVNQDFIDNHVIVTSAFCTPHVELINVEDFTDDVCPGGYFRLTYRARNKDSKGLYDIEFVDVYIDDLVPLECDHINWPDPYVEVECPDLEDEPYLDWNADACDLIGWTYRSDTFRFESGACLKIINEYTVIDWCVFDEYYDDFGQGTISNPTGQPGYFEGGHDYLDGILCEDPVNWPDNRVSDNGVYKYVEIIKVVDEDAPVITVENQMFEASADDCDSEITLVASATDASDTRCPDTWFKWEITIDWDESGTFDLDERYTRDRFGGVLRGEDGTLTFDVWDLNSTSTPRALAVVDGPMTTYDVQYIVYDGCGNVDKEIRNFMVVDKKPPTPYCVSLSSALMAPNADGDQMVELWARDFNVGSFDNCTDQDDLLFTFNEENPVLSKINSEHYFKGAGEDATEAEYLQGDAQLWRPADNSSARVFTCEDYLASPVEVRMTVWDEKLLSDWCMVELTLVNNQGDCGDQGSRAAVSGNISTEEDSDVSEVSVTLENLSNPEYELTVTTGNDGDFAFASNPMYNGYDISAVKDGDDTEGVSTLDLVLIQRHILGITSFDSPYKVIAADINSDRRVSGTDLVVLRKTILGIYKEFPTNNSWRFVERAQSLTVDNALSDFNEVINIQDLAANMLNEDFVAVKIGDVNATAKTNARDLGTQTRSAGTLTLGLEEQNVVEGQLVDLTFTSNDFNKVYGYQFTLELNGLTIESVVAGDANMSEANIGILNENTVTVSYSDMQGLGTSNNLFTLSAVATETGNIGNMISLTNSALNNEGYVGEGLDIHTIELTINGEEATSFRLDQNEPNPFQEVTIVGFELPESGNATLTVYDVAGKIITTVRGAYAQGYNEIKLDKEDLNTTGVLYYTLRSGEFTATKKMIIIE